MIIFCYNAFPIYTFPNMFCLRVLQKQLIKFLHSCHPFFQETSHLLGSTQRLNTSGCRHPLETDRQTKYTPPCTHLQPLAVLRFPWGLCISYSLCGVFLSYPIFSSFSLQAKSGVMSQQRQIEVVEKHEGGNTEHSNSATVVVTLCSQNFFWEISPEISQFLCSWV